MRVSYKDMNYVFITNFYDRPLSGFCMHEGELHRFEETDESCENDEYEVYKMTRWEKNRAWFSQKCFELCVGTHWSWGGGRRKDYFYWRRPKWLHKILFKVYYTLTKR